MKTTFVSTSATSQAMRLSILKAQTELAEAQKEVASGRWADMGLQLGSQTGSTVSLRAEHARLTTMVETNGITATRLDATQVALTSMLTGANDFLHSLISGRDADTGAEVLQPEARHKLEGLISALNTAMGGQQLFAGINTDVAPITDYFATPAPANKQAVDNAFAAAFGMPQSGPGVSTITPADMQTFLDGDFAALFDEPNWSADWSSASSQNVRSRIALSEVVETSANANEPVMKKLAMAYTMVADLGIEGLSGETYRVVVDKAVTLMGEAVQELNTVQGRLGTTQGRISQANERMSLQIDLVLGRIAGLENVDPYEASTRISGLMTQVETAYALTARIERLGLLKYL